MKLGRHVAPAKAKCYVKVHLNSCDGLGKIRSNVIKVTVLDLFYYYKVLPCGLGI